MSNLLIRLRLFFSLFPLVSYRRARKKDIHLSTVSGQNLFATQ